MTLAELKNGEKAIITKVRGRGAFRKRIIEMGFVVGKQVTVIKNAPLRDPIEYHIMGYDVSLRRSEAALIEVTKDMGMAGNGNKFEGTFQLASDSGNPVRAPHTKTINVALVGNPNSGKTTLFNFASNSKEKVGNYGGLPLMRKALCFTTVDIPLNLSIYPVPTPLQVIHRKNYSFANISFMNSPMSFSMW